MLGLGNQLLFIHGVSLTRSQEHNSSVRMLYRDPITTSILTEMHLFARLFCGNSYRDVGYASFVSVFLGISPNRIGTPTSLPWGIALFGATRHPTQIYLALQGLTLLPVETLRADSVLLSYGVRSTQVVGLLLIG